jgi:hypothetical protein
MITIVRVEHDRAGIDSIGATWQDADGCRSGNRKCEASSRGYGTSSW